MPLRELGRTGVEDLVDRCCRYCRDLALGIGELQGASVVVQPTLNQGRVRFQHPDPAATKEDSDGLTDDVIERINATGEAFFSGTIWRGERAMRISVVNWRTNDEDGIRAVSAVARALQL